MRRRRTCTTADPLPTARTYVPARSWPSSRQLLSIERAEAIPALQSIAARFGAERAVAALVTTKIRELEAYAALEKSPLLQRDRST